jgi:hypothetical protein
VHVESKFTIPHSNCLITLNNRRRGFIGNWTGLAMLKELPDIKREKCWIHSKHVNDKDNGDWSCALFYISKKCLSIILMGRPDELCFGSICLHDFMRYISDRTDSNADSTLEVSSADVSMCIMPFSAVQNKGWRVSKQRRYSRVRSECTGKFCSYFGGYDAKCFKVRFIPNEHDDDMWARMLA